MSIDDGRISHQPSNLIFVITSFLLRWAVSDVKFADFLGAFVEVFSTCMFRWRGHSNLTRRGLYYLQANHFMMKIRKMFSEHVMIFTGAVEVWMLSVELCSQQKSDRNFQSNLAELADLHSNADGYLSNAIQSNECWGLETAIWSRHFISDARAAWCEWLARTNDSHWIGESLLGCGSGLERNSDKARTHTHTHTKFFWPRRSLVRFEPVAIFTMKTKIDYSAIFDVNVKRRLDIAVMRSVYHKSGIARYLDYKSFAPKIYE